MIYTIGVNHLPDTTSYTKGLFRRFVEWITPLKEYQLDIETTVTNWWCDKELVTIQFGSIDGKTQWLLDWRNLTPEQRAIVKEILENRNQTKLIHNAQFEYVVLAFHGIILNNIYDSMIAEQVINGGQQVGKGKLPVGFYSLAGLCMRYCCVDLDKSQQMTFNMTEPLTSEQVIYAADDVKYIAPIRRMQIDQLKVNLSHAPLEFVAGLEMEALLGYSDMMVEGMELNTDEWLANLDLVEPIIQRAESECLEQMQTDPKLYARAVQLGYINTEDKSLINWDSPQQKLKLLQSLPEDKVLGPITGTSKLMLTKLIKSKHAHSDILQLFIDQDWQKVGEYFYDNYRQQMIDADLIRPAGDVTINWNSVPQVLPLLQAIVPRMKSMDEENMNRFPHPIGEKIKEYKETLKLRTTYGEEFINKYLEPDGKIRTTFNQIVTTGRLSSHNPNMQNIPNKESVGNRYKNCFKAPPGWDYISGDYTGQELGVIAYLSKDPVWTETILKGQDIHSVCAEMVWGKKWVNATEANCAYYHKTNGQIDKLKCECKKHKHIRFDTKAVDFGLAYGMTEYKLAADTKTSVPEARKLMHHYFEVFPKIGGLLNYFGKFAVEKGYIQTIWPFYRKRFFPEWKEISKTEIQMHLAGVQHNWKLAAIERAGKNAPVQGTSGDMSKTSVCMLRWYIDENNLRNKVKLVMQIHDANDTISERSYSPEWKIQLKRIMEEAALFLIPNGLVKADVSISESWNK